MNEELIKRVVANLNEKWGNEEWNMLSEDEKLRVVNEFLDEVGLPNDLIK